MKSAKGAWGAIWRRRRPSATIFWLFFLAISFFHAPTYSFADDLGKEDLPEEVVGDLDTVPEVDAEGAQVIGDQFEGTPETYVGDAAFQVAGELVQAEIPVAVLKAKRRENDSDSTSDAILPEEETTVQPTLVLYRGGAGFAGMAFLVLTMGGGVPAAILAGLAQGSVSSAYMIHDKKYRRWLAGGNIVSTFLKQWAVSFVGIFFVNAFIAMAGLHGDLGDSVLEQVGQLASRLLVGTTLNVVAFAPWLRNIEEWEKTLIAHDPAHRDKHHRRAFVRSALLGVAAIVIATAYGVGKSLDMDWLQLASAGTLLAAGAAGNFTFFKKYGSLRNTIAEARFATRRLCEAVLTR